MNIYARGPTTKGLKDDAIGTIMKTIILASLMICGTGGLRTNSAVFRADLTKQYMPRPDFILEEEEQLLLDGDIEKFSYAQLRGIQSMHTQRSFLKSSAK